MLSVSNCGRVCMCVFLLSTAYHRNGKPVSICKPQTGWMLHVMTFSGNMVMDGVVHLPLLSLLIPVVSWVLSSSSSAVCRAHIISGTYWVLPCINFCMSLSLLLSYHINERCPSSLPPAQDFPRDYSCFDTLSEVHSENVVEIPRCLCRRGECKCQDNWHCTGVFSLDLLLLVNFTKDCKQAQAKLMYSNWCLQQRPLRAQLLPLMAHESPQISIWPRGGATNESYSVWEGLSLFPSLRYPQNGLLLLFHLTTMV